MTQKEKQIREFVMLVDEVLTNKRNQPLYDEVIAQIISEVYKKLKMAR